ncbi:hypothetical protein ACFQZC_06155 [Streptacidiphilus monticola]
MAAAVEEVKRLLDAGRIPEAVAVLGGALSRAEAQHGADSPVARALRRQHAVLTGRQ